MKPIYEPKGAAKEYGDLAINIYTGCPHRCFYCYAPTVLHRNREQFHACVEPRRNVVEEVAKQLDREHITGKLIHLCFTCDPYPRGKDSAATREIIKLLKASGNHVQILTKGDGRRDFDLLDEGDWYGVTLDCRKNSHASGQILLSAQLKKAHDLGIKTWASFEPVLDPDEALWGIKFVATFTDRVKIGKLNYHPSSIDWADFGAKAERLCKDLRLDYYIKESLRSEMEVTDK